MSSALSWMLLYDDQRGGFQLIPGAGRVAVKPAVINFGLLRYRIKSGKTDRCSSFDGKDGGRILGSATLDIFAHNRVDQYDRSAGL